MNIKIKRVYERPGKENGMRTLVGALWPRGPTKAKASAGLRLKDIAPSMELRKSFGHEPDKWTDFKTRYCAQLKKNGEQVTLPKRKINKWKVTLIYGTKDDEHNDAVVLQTFLSRRPTLLLFRSPAAINRLRCAG
jgi:uncharacterized protein YeaO (DUF488 family)